MSRVRIMLPQTMCNKLQEAACAGELNFISLQLITMQQKGQGDQCPP